MFLVCESIAWGMEHTPFNAALLRTINFAFPNHMICFYGEDSHSRYVRKQIGEELAASILWKKLALPSRHSSFYARQGSDFNTVKFLLNELNANPQENVLVITGNASILWALKHYLRTIHKNKKVQVILHGDFSTLHRIPRRSLLNPLYYIGSLKNALRIHGYERLQHIVLEEAVRDSILKKMPFLRNNVFVLDHPIPLDEENIEKDIFGPPFQFGFLGHTSEQKGFSIYLNVASEISKRYSEQVKFHLIGWISDKQRCSNYSKMTYLNDKPRTERMSRKEYVNRLRDLHYVCLFYNKYYESCASGVLMDSIAWKKPIIATQLPIFEAIQKQFGDIGYLCRTNELSATVSSILEKENFDRYKRQVANMGRVKSSRKPEILAKKYFKLVNFL